MSDNNLTPEEVANVQLQLNGAKSVTLQDAAKALRSQARRIAELEEQLANAARNYFSLQISPSTEKRASVLIETFEVKHYIGDARPTIKGNGFDGLEIGEDREDVQAFIDWVNARLVEAFGIKLPTRD